MYVKKRRQSNDSSQTPAPKKKKLDALKDDKKTTRLYRRKGSRVKKALSFSTPNNTKLA